MNAQENDNGMGEAKAQLDTIVELITALNCDFDRLEELRDELKDLDVAVRDADGDEELADAIKARDDWTSEYAEELAELSEEAGEFTDRDEVMERIQEEPLEIQVRGGWRSPGEDSEDDEFYILLSTGGPACRIIGELDSGSPSRPRLQYQDWFVPWTELICTGSHHEALEAFCECFFFGE